MSLMNLKNTNAVVVGLGLTGQSCVEFLLQQGANVVGMDKRSSVECPYDIKVKTGKYRVKTLLKADLVVISPGVDPSAKAIQRAVEQGIEVIGDIELFARFNKVPVIAITGSNGKSTVTCLVAEMLNCAGKKALMGGNIGKPVLSLLNEDADYLILELSSFQLETVVSLKPLAATILNVCEDHLDRHLTFDAYKSAKQKIYENAENCIYNRDDLNTLPKDPDVHLSFGLSASDSGYSWDDSTQTILREGDPLLRAEESVLSGIHNMLNVQAAMALTECADVGLVAIRQAVKKFTGLTHRFETVSQFKNVTWINDSKATNVGATIAAIESLAARTSGKLILIAGGDGKGADFSGLQSILLESVDLLITLGKDGPAIASLKPGSIQVTSLQEAVSFINSIVNENDIVLLSPACASLDMFDNYQHRGDVFAAAVRGLAA